MKRALVAGAAVAALAAAAVLFFMREGGPVAVTVPAGLSARETSFLLAQKGIVRSAKLFRIVASRTGADRRLKPGAYKLRENMWLPSLLAQLQAGGNEGVKVAIPEGFSSKQVAERLEAEGVCKAEAFLRVVQAQKLEGYLFPTTYFFDPATPPERAATRMREEFKKRAEPEFSAPGRPNLSAHQLLTLASIVEREAVLSQERPMIASVYLNRMRIRMRLEADPTVQYALGRWKKGLTSADLKDPSPYNTYVHYGLPPGPICNPGLDSIHAATHPALTDYIFFVADTTGGHRFSATLEEHVQAKRSYKRTKRLLEQQQKKKN